MKNILGLDLGITSISFAHIVEDENKEKSEIKELGVRIVSLTTDEQSDFEKGKSITTNANRTLKHGARLNLDRYQQRRKYLIDLLQKANLITSSSILAENGKNTTHSTWQLRAKAVTERIEKEEFARVLLAINKKRGYKSSRKAKTEDEGQAIDGMAIAKCLYDENLTPGQLSLQLLQQNKKLLPDFYRSDLQKEFDLVWNLQKQFYPDILTDSFYKELQGKGKDATSKAFSKRYHFDTAENKGSKESVRLQAYQWRAEAISKQLSKEEVAYVLTEINNNLNNASGYLGAISDRSKELYFNRQTVGQYLYAQLQENRHNSLKNKVFYRQDYLDEFERIWETQASFHKELTDELKKQIRDVVIFYQRKLKSQKGLISFCEFESKEIEIEKDGKTITKSIGARVVPKSSPLFQEFKIWQILNNVTCKRKGIRKKKSSTNPTQLDLFNEPSQTIFSLDMECKQLLFDELNLKGDLKSDKVLKLLGYSPQEWEINYNQLEGNRTQKALYEAYLKIVEMEAHDVKDILQIKSAKDDWSLDESPLSASEIKEKVKDIFQALGICTKILYFDPLLPVKEFEEQDSYQLWHLLYSYESDDSTSGNETLYRILEKKYAFKREHARILANVALQDDYGSLSTKAIRKIYPNIKENQYSKACELAGYKHSKLSLTTEELEARELKNIIPLLKKNALRNPVVEKILNQMINVVNALIEKNSERDAEGKITKYFHFDEIRIELARELKKNAQERYEMTQNINKAKLEHQKISEKLQKQFGIKNPTKSDIIRYRLYQELEHNGYKELYTNTYIAPDVLFSKNIDIEHIIPKARVFDDSFSNKTLAFKDFNIKKGEYTAFDYITSLNNEEKLNQYLARVENAYKTKSISLTKYKDLLKKASEIGDGFINRDLRDTQYIAKKAKEILFQVTKNVLSTSGNITDRLREDWGLVNVMKELNMPKYQSLGLTEVEERKDGNKVTVIKDWTKRNDHRHHAMDALTVAFTKPSYIQYLNHLNARKDENNKNYSVILAIEKKETIKVPTNNGKNKRVFIEPIPNFRQVAKKHLEEIFISHKAKNKVVTKNINKPAGTDKQQITLIPRGQLHKETIYGKYQYYVNKEEKVGVKFDERTITKVSNPLYREALLKRLQANDNDPKKAFAGKNALSKNPIYLDEAKTKTLPEKVNLTYLEEDFSIRKDISPDNFKDLKSIEKVIDQGVKRILIKRLQAYDNDPKKAFVDLEKNPIWLNKEKGIAIKRVTISGVSNAQPLHIGKDHLGKTTLNKEGKEVPVDYVSTGNNHHVAIYRDKEGNLQEQIVSFFEAVVRAQQGLPIIDKNYKQAEGWQFMFTMKQNEMFVFPNEATGFNPAEIDLLDPKNKKLISPNLFRVQTISIVKYGNSVVRDFKFRHHLETTLQDDKILQGITFQQIKSLEPLRNIVKVRINHLGDIVNIGEY